MIVNEGLVNAYGRTTLDHEQLVLSNTQFKGWIRRQRDRKDITVSQREDLLAANFWLAQTPTITITNERNGI